MTTTTSRKRRASKILERQPLSRNPDISTSPEGRILRYKFEPLVYANEIRLLRVTKSSSHEGWEYSIEHHVLETAPSFETVSYVWGDGNQRHTLSIGVTPGDRSYAIFINENLQEAIPWLSWHCRTGYLWIDQICINQISINERNHQVKIMGKIYSHGKRVLVWLKGTPINCYLVELNEICEVSYEKRDCVHLMREMLLKALKRPDAIDGRNALIRIFQNQWFTRAWVFQEAVASKRADFVSGKHTLGFLSLYHIAQAAISEESPSSIRHALQQERGCDILQDMYGIKCPKAERAIHLSSMQGGSFSDFRRFLSMVASTMHASDIRDLIFAFSGTKALSPFPFAPPPLYCQQHQRQITLTVNYALPYRQVLIDVAASMIRDSETLDILENVCPHWPQPGSDFHVPSWVPVWNHAPKQPPLQYSRRSTILHEWAADCQRGDGDPRTLNHVWLESGSTLKLRVRGACITTITEASSPPFSYVSTQRFCPVDELRRYINLDANFNAIDKRLSEGQATREELLNVIMAGRAETEELSRFGVGYEQSVNSHELLEAYDRMENPSHYLISPYERRLISTIQFYTYLAKGRRIFLAANNKLGLASDPMPGDQIFILRGCIAPVILRHVSGKEYRFVELCYLQDAMYGKMVTWQWEDADDILLV